MPKASSTAECDQDQSEASAAQALTRAKALTPKPAVVRMSLLLARAMSAADVSERQLAGALTVSQSRVRDWRNSAHPQTLPLHRLDEIREKLPTLYHHVVTLLVEADSMRGETCVQRGVLLVGKEVGELQARLVEAMADGSLSDEEKRAIDREAADVGAAVVRLRKGLNL